MQKPPKPFAPCAPNTVAGLRATAGKVPEGQTRIVQRFNVGKFRSPITQVPKGRAENFGAELLPLPLLSLFCYFRTHLQPGAVFLVIHLPLGDGKRFEHYVGLSCGELVSISSQE